MTRTSFRPVDVTPRPSGALAALSLAMLMASLGTSIANVGLPSLGQAFGVPFGQLQWIVLAYLLASTTLVVGAGRLGDAIGRRRLLLTGLALFTVASALCGAAPTLGLLVAARAAQGLGAAMMMAMATALAGETVPKARMGRAMGLLGTMSAIGTALGPTLGGVLLAFLGWPALFLVNLPLGLVALWLAHRQVPAGRPGAAGRVAGFDWLGTLLLGLSLGAYALAMTAGGAGAAPFALLAIAAIAAFAFLRVERRSTAPLLHPSLFRDGALGGGLTTNGLVSTVMMATLVVGPFHLARALALEPALVGLAMSAGPLVAALAGVPAGRLVDRFGSRGIVTLGLLVSASGAAGLAAAPVSLGIAGYVVPLAVTTAGYALFQAANNTAVMADVPPDRRGLASGMLALSRNLGLITGASAMGAIFAAAAGAADVNTASAGAVAAATRTTFAIAATMLILALAIALATRRAAAAPALPRDPA